MTTLFPRRRVPIARTAALALLAAASPLLAQTVRGVTVDAAGQPVSGVIAILLDSASATVSRSLSGASGRFSLSAPNAGTYRIRAIRIGFRPTTTPPIRLERGGEVEQRVVLDALALALDTVRVADRAVCEQVARDSTAAVFSAWEQVRGALTAAQVTATGRTIVATTVGVERTLDPSNKRIRSQHTTVRSGYVREPWRALPVDSLHRAGYVVKGREDSTTFYAPGLDMLLSTAFVEDHCFRLGRASDAKRLALEFEPTRERRRVAEIKGTLWLDRASSELRRLEFGYVNIPSDQAEHSGGDMEFTRISDGGWVISRWSIRMPELERVLRDRAFASQPMEAIIRVAALQLTGGTLTTVVSGRDTLWSRSPVALTGTIVDSVSGNGVAKGKVALAGTKLEATADDRGRFVIHDVLPGAYTAEVRTPALDSLNAVHSLELAVADSNPTVEIRVPTPRQIEATLCGTKRLDEPGIVIGRVQLPQGDSLPADARVTATWMIAHLETGGAGVSERRERRSLEARVFKNGDFRLCGVPLNTELSIAASGTNAESPESEHVRIPIGSRFARTDVGLERLAAGKAVFSGIVMADTTAQPLAAADVLLVDLGIGTRTSDLGEFRLAGIVAGTHHVVIRHLGFSALDTTLAFGSGEHVQRRLSLARATVLDSVRVLANATPRSMWTFDEHRKLGLGHFMTRAELAKAENQTIGAVLRSFSGMRLVPGVSTQLWAASGRNRATFIAVERADKNMGARPDCYAVVYLNGVVLYHGRDNEPLFDVNTIRPDQLEGVEYYAGPSETPMEYGTVPSNCGVLALWTRRTP